MATASVFFAATGNDNTAFEVKGKGEILDRCDYIMNLNTIYTHVREIAGETASILDKMEEYEGEATETHVRFAEARTLVTVLRIAARCELPREVQSLWNALGAQAAVDPSAPVDVMHDHPVRSANC